MAAPSGSLTLTGLSFTVFNATDNQWAITALPSSWAATMTDLCGRLNSNATTGIIYRFNAGAVADAAGDLAAGCSTYFCGNIDLV